MLPIVLVDIIVEYSFLFLNNPEDLDEVYNRLLTLEEFQKV